MPLEANGLRFQVRDEGDGEPVPLLHGFPDSVDGCAMPLPAVNVQGVLDALGIERANVAGYDRNASDDCDAVRGVAAYCRTGRRRGSQTYIASRMSFTEEPTHIWEVGEPAPFEITQPCHEPAVPELEPACL